MINLTPFHSRIASAGGTVLVRFCAVLVLAAGATTAVAGDWDSLQLLGREVPAGSSQRFPAVPDRTFEASYLNMPVFVARGAAARTHSLHYRRRAR